MSDVSGSAIRAGFLAVLVSYAGRLLIYLSAAEAMGISKEELSAFRPRVLYLRQPLPSQKAFITMLALPRDGPLVEPFSDNAAMLRKLDWATGSLLFHCAYVTQDFEATYQDFRKKGWVPIIIPFIGKVPGRKLSHRYHCDFGLIEIMDPTPAISVLSGAPGSSEA